MRKEIIAEGLDKIDDAFIMEAAAELAGDEEESGHRLPRKRPRVRFGRGMIAACLTVLILAGSGVGAYVSEMSKLHAAEAFFDEYGLSMEGLNSAEVKAVYRDISQNQFTYEKTAAVVQGVAPGFETGREKQMPEELAVVWDSSNGRSALPQSGIGYRKGYQYTLDKKLGFNVLKKSVLACYRDGELLWSAEFPEFYVEDCLLTENGTVVWGRSYTWSEEQRVISWVALVDGEGETLWKYSMDHGEKQETIVSVLDNGDGTLAVISRREPSCLCLSQWDKNGTEDIRSSIDIQNSAVGLVTRLGDGYLVRLDAVFDSIRFTETMLYMDRDGSITALCIYEDEQFDYYLRDMKEYAGKTFISAYAAPCQRDVRWKNPRNNIWPQLYEGISEKEVAAIVRANYTAVLLEVDPATGIPKPYYSIDGAKGGSLSVDEDGLLNWQVNCLDSISYNPKDTYHRITFYATRYWYRLNEAGELVDRKLIGDMSGNFSPE